MARRADRRRRVLSLIPSPVSFGVARECDALRRLASTLSPASREELLVLARALVRVEAHASSGESSIARPT